MTIVDDIKAATVIRDARERHPDRDALERLPLGLLREYVEEAARDHGVQCVMAGHCYDTPAWLRFRMALDVLSKRGAR